MLILVSDYEHFLRVWFSAVVSTFLLKTGEYYHNLYSLSPIIRKFVACFRTTSNTSEQWSRKIRPYIPQKDISLSRLSMVTIITDLWTNGTLEKHLQDIIASEKSLLEERKPLTGKAIAIIKQLKLPPIVLQQMLTLVEWISLEFIGYLDRLMNNEFFPYTGNIGEIVKNIRWNMHGGIDEVQTFKTMQYENYHYNFIVSSLYCLEDDIPVMWARLSPVLRPIFSLKKIYSRGFDSYAAFVIHYWTCRVKNRQFFIENLLDPIGLFNAVPESSTNLKMLIVSLHSYNVHAFKYFWGRLNDNERTLAISTLCDVYETDDLCMLSNFYETVRNSIEIILFVIRQVDNDHGLMIVRRCLPQMIVNFWQCWQVHHVILPLFESYIDLLDVSTYKELFTRLQAQHSDYSPKGRLLYRMWLSSPPHLQCLMSDEEKRAMFENNVVMKMEHDNS